MATYAFDDEPTLTSAKVTGTNTVTLEFSEELVGGSTVNEWCEQHGEWVHGETVTLTLTLVERCGLDKSFDDERCAACETQLDQR